MLSKLLLVALCVASLTAPTLAAQTFDVLLQGGHVIDPKNNMDRVMDVAISGGKIARVAVSIPVADAKQVVDVRGLYVTPGLIDIHVHVFAGGGVRDSFAGGDFGVNPDGMALRNCVTAVADAGS